MLLKFVKSRMIKKLFVFGLLLNPNCGNCLDYSFSSTIGTYNENVGGTVIWVSGDDLTSNNIPLGFNFNFGNNSSIYEISVNTNGWIALGSNFLANSSSYLNNNLTTTSFGPIIAPLWDDLSIGSGGNVNYLTTGNTGSKIFTIEWSKMKWDWAATGSVISFQIKLYEATGDIEFFYREESGGINSGSASIGIANQSATDFWSLSNASTSPIANYGVETNSISTKPISGQIYKWSRINDATVSIVSSSNSICFGTVVNFDMTSTNGGGLPTYQWFINGNIVGTGLNYSSSNLSDNDTITCVMTTSGANQIITTSNEIVMNVTSIPSTPSIVADGNILTSSSSIGNQWYLNNVAILNAINQNYTVTENGDYSVIVSNNNCSSPPSSIFTINSVGIVDGLIEKPLFEIFPNPCNGNFIILLNSIEAVDYQIEIQNESGQIVYYNELNNVDGSNKNEFDLSEYEKGAYFITLTDSKNKQVKKIILH